jgi:5S rRNA maturation endonuclease (ribonuclease M5)
MSGMKRKIGRWGSRRSREAKMDEAAEIIDCLKEMSMEGAVIIVEGERDEKILRDLGITGAILKYSEMGRLRLIQSIEEEDETMIVILTDFDEEGEKILGKLESIALHYGLKIEKRMRRRLFETLHPYASCIEDLAKLAEEINRRYIASL